MEVGGKVRNALVSVCGLWDCTHSKWLFWLRECLFWGFTSMNLNSAA